MLFLTVANQKFILAVEANSALAAEHKLLDELDGIEGAQAFDSQAIKTDTFAGFMTDGVTVSFKELKEISDNYSDKCSKLAIALEVEKMQKLEVERLTRELEAAKEELNVKHWEARRARLDVNDAKKALNIE